VVAINRYAWSQSIGIGGRNHPVRARRTTRLKRRGKNLILRGFADSIEAGAMNEWLAKVLATSTINSSSLMAASAAFSAGPATAILSRVAIDGRPNRTEQ
jgi:hypothetical protein